jgi:radical SAM protein
MNEKPLLVFWETTKACLLSCRHCRAEAITKPLPNELSTNEGKILIDQISAFGKPSPILVFSGGDPLMRSDIWDLIDYANKKEIISALAPSVTPKLDDKAIDEISNHNISSVSISIDSPYKEVHDEIRGVAGTWDRSIQIIKQMMNKGIKVQVNTSVMRSTVNGLPDMVNLLINKLNVNVWEVFYLIPVGRAKTNEDLTKEEWEDVSAFLYEASKYNLIIRTSEGPMFRRIVLLYKNLEDRGANVVEDLPHGKLYFRLIKRLYDMMGKPNNKSMAETHGTRDGKGIIFVSHDGFVYPSGFLPFPVGNIRKDSIVNIYRKSEIMIKLRSSELKGKCGNCEFKDICGGSRARAFSYTNDLLEEDPACLYKPGSYSSLLSKYGLSYNNLLAKR